MDRDRARGALLGLAVGDALGRPVVFESPARIVAQYGTVTEMLGDGSWNRPAGTITDETETTVRVARSLVEQGQFEPCDVATRLVSWFAEDPFDVDSTTAAAVGRLRDGEPWHLAGRLVYRHGTHPAGDPGTPRPDAAGSDSGRPTGGIRDRGVGPGRRPPRGDDATTVGDGDPAAREDRRRPPARRRDGDAGRNSGRNGPENSERDAPRRSDRDPTEGFDDEPVATPDGTAMRGGSGDRSEVVIGCGAAASGGMPRAVPLALAYGEGSYRLAAVARTASRITHAAPSSTAAAALLAVVVAGYLQGATAPLAQARRLVDLPRPLLEATAPLVSPDDAGPVFPPSTPARRESVAATVRVALGCATLAESAEDAVVRAVNAGGNADTVGAICGAVAGARFGASSLPDRWLAAVDRTDELRRLADALREGTFDRDRGLGTVAAD